LSNTCRPVARTGTGRPFGHPAHVFGRRIPGQPRDLPWRPPRAETRPPHLCSTWNSPPGPRRDSAPHTRMPTPAAFPVEHPTRCPAEPAATWTRLVLLLKTLRTLVAVIGRPAGSRDHVTSVTPSFPNSASACDSTVARGHLPGVLFHVEQRVSHSVALVRQIASHPPLDPRPLFHVERATGPHNPLASISPVAPCRGSGGCNEGGLPASPRCSTWNRQRPRISGSRRRAFGLDRRPGPVRASPCTPTRVPRHHDPAVPRGTGRTLDPRALSPTLGESAPCAHTRACLASTSHA
jgi:hypothetical protein